MISDKKSQEDPTPAVNLDSLVMIENIDNLQNNATENAAQVEKNLLANIERFVTRIRMVAQQVIQHRIDSNDNNDTENKSDFKFDPDGDGFDLNYEKALRLHNNMNLL